MNKHDRTAPSDQGSRDATTDNLYNLGLLSPPRNRSREGSSKSTRAVHCKTWLSPFHCRLGSQEPVSIVERHWLTHLFRVILDQTTLSRNQSYGSQRGDASIRSSDSQPNYKQSAISTGTLGRPRTPQNHKYQTTRDRRVPPPAPRQARSGGQMASMLDADRSRSRRERTFVGGECAACEELLEHTLRGERILQFSCGHVAHEACFYEIIKESDAQAQYCPTCEAPLGLDSFRGGSILDLSKCRPFNLRIVD